MSSWHRVCHWSLRPGALQLRAKNGVTLQTIFRHQPETGGAPWGPQQAGGNPRMRTQSFQLFIWYPFLDTKSLKSLSLNFFTCKMDLTQNLLM